MDHSWPKLARLRKAQAQPCVVVFPDQSGGDPRHIDLVIKNFGATATTDVRVKFSAPVESAVLSPEFSPIKIPDVIPVLVPGQEWRTFWDFGPSRHDNPDMARQYTAQVSFQDARSKESFSFRFDIDWQTLIDRGFVTIYTMHDVGRALKEIRDLLDKWNETGAGLRVIARDGDQKDAREQDYWNQRKAEQARLDADGPKPGASDA